MEVREVTAREYGAYFTGRPHIYNSTAFATLNEHKVEAVRYLLLCDSKVRFGIIIGDGRSPFSAPFGGLDYNRGQGFEQVDEAIVALKEYLGSPIRITLPPPCYGGTMVTMMVSSLLRYGRLVHADVNYHFVTDDITTYEEALDSNGKNKLRQSIEHFGNDEDAFLVAEAARAYEVIRRNREEHHYPLRMTLEEVVKTTAIIPADFFVLTHGGQDVAAAQVFHVAEGIAQVIYWGDVHAYSHLRPMNYLAYRLFQYYHECGIGIVDVGPATEGGTPNYGLCAFKQSIGCRASLKYTFEL